MGKFVFQMGGFIFKWRVHHMKGGGGIGFDVAGFQKKIIVWGKGGVPHAPHHYGKPCQLTFFFINVLPKKQ